MNISDREFFSVNTDGPLVTITFNAERIDMYNAKDLLELVKRSFPVINFENMIVDCNRLRYIDSTAIGVLMVSMGWLKKSKFKGDIIFVSDKSSLYKIRDLTKLKIRIFKNLEDAVFYLKQTA